MSNFVFCPLVRPDDFDEGNKDKDDVENADDKEVECSRYRAADTHSALFGFVQKECDDHDNWHEPESEPRPSLKDLVFHLVGEEGEEKYNDKWEKKRFLGIIKRNRTSFQSNRPTKRKFIYSKN
ncbi:MAG: hypothetical protein HYV45_04020 [Candidatus Moranbacteria bacterium]|nr:hypothetical protein [Candidatus Moranbacteria bacterium]